MSRKLHNNTGKIFIYELFKYVYSFVGKEEIKVSFTTHSQVTQDGGWEGSLCLKKEWLGKYLGVPGVVVVRKRRLGLIKSGSETRTGGHSQLLGVISCQQTFLLRSGVQQRVSTLLKIKLLLVYIIL